MDVVLNVETDSRSQANFMFEQGGMNQRLARNAAPVDTGSPQHAFLEHKYPCSEARGVQRGSERGRAGSEYYQVVSRGHGCSFRYNPALHPESGSWALSSAAFHASCCQVYHESTGLPLVSTS